MERKRIRLMIVIPAVILLLTLGVGVVNYEVTVLILEKQGARAVNAVLDDLSWRILGWSLFITFLALIFGLGFAYSIVRPIKTITRTAEDITRGILDRKVYLARQPMEIGELGSSFNRVVDYLHQLFEERNRYVLESFTGGLITTDISGNIMAINSAAEKLLGQTAQNAVGKNLLKLLRKKHPDSALIPVIEDVLTHRRVVTSRPVNFAAPGGSVVSLLVNASVMKDRSGKPLGCVINFRDLSKIQAFHARMQRADNLAALGTFAMGIAHELRNPLSAVKGITQLLEAEMPEDSRAKTYCLRIIREADRLDRVIQSIHDFSHHEPAPAEICDLNSIAHDALEIAKSRVAPLETISSDINIVEQYDDLPPCRLQPERTMQALLNIVINAFEATPPGGTITLRSGVDASTKDANQVALEISNTGSYIPKDQMDKIFDPFYTSKPDGTGLGLPIAYQIITYNNGEITVKSDPEKTAFFVRFSPVQSAPS